MEQRHVWYNGVNNELYDYGVFMHKALLTHLVVNPSQNLEWHYLGFL